MGERTVQSELEIAGIRVTLTTFEKDELMWTRIGDSDNAVPLTDAKGVQLTTAAFDVLTGRAAQLRSFSASGDTWVINVGVEDGALTYLRLMTEGSDPWFTTTTVWGEADRFDTAYADVLVARLKAEGFTPAMMAFP